MLNDGVVKVSLVDYLNKAELILHKGCQQYTQSLSKVFSTSEKRFKTTQFEIILIEKPSLISEFEGKIQSENAEIFSLSKSENSMEFY